LGAFKARFSKDRRANGSGRLNRPEVVKHLSTVIWILENGISRGTQAIEKTKEATAISSVWMDSKYNVVTSKKSKSI
jgi:hypothetical protein